MKGIMCELYTVFFVYLHVWLGKGFNKQLMVRFRVYAHSYYPFSTTYKQNDVL